jgi:hypothetical protein
MAISRPRLASTTSLSAIVRTDTISIDGIALVLLEVSVATGL